jgi:hypothetical protein
MFVVNGIFSGLPQAWVVKWQKCDCTINCRAIDPQTEHAEPDKSDLAPQHPVIVSCSCCWTVFRYSPTQIFKGQPAPSSTCFERGRSKADNKGRSPNNKGAGEKAEFPPSHRLFPHCRSAIEPRRNQGIAFGDSKDLGEYPPCGDDPGKVDH